MTAALATLCTAHPGLSGVQLLDDGPAALAVRIALVRRARISIDAQYYIWQPDVSGRLLLEELAAAAARGVRVRLLLDDFGSPRIPPLLPDLPGLELRMFNPVRLRWPRWLNWLFDFPRLNRRMHNKSLTVDGIAAIIGGRNIGDEYFDATHPGLAADLDVIAIGAIAAETTANFGHYWHSPAAVPHAAVPGAVLPPGEDSPVRQTCLAAAASPATAAMIDASDDFIWAGVRILSDPPGKISGDAAEMALLLPQLLAALGPVTRHFLLVSAYFIPTPAVAALLGTLARQGVQVDVLTNSLLSNNVSLVHAWYAPWRRRLLAVGVRLWEMRGAAGARARLGLVPRNLLVRLRRPPGTHSFFRSSASALHAKTLVADGRWLFVGSMNVDERSLHLNTEMGFLIDSPALASRLEAGLTAGLPRFAWAVEALPGGLAWRDGDRLLQPEPGTTAPLRLAIRLLGLLPLGHLF